jgi:alpha-methylacyl-CoA racemase
MSGDRDGKPLAGIRVLEFEGLGPAPYAGMLMAELGAHVRRIRKPGPSDMFAVENSLINYGREDATVDLKSADGVRQCLEWIRESDVLIEGFRPGVMERLGLGPEAAFAVNPRLIYGRMTGWGQTGPRANTAGHDITYLALTGALHAMGPADGPPVPPLNLIGDMGGGGMFLVMKVLAALLQRDRTDTGAAIDAAIVDGVASQLSLILGLRQAGLWSAPRGQNLLDGGAPFYRCYTCADGRFVAVGALEPRFFRILLDGLGLPWHPYGERQYDRTFWPELESVLTRRFLDLPRDEWALKFEGTDACLAPVLALDEVYAPSPTAGESG